MPKLSCRSRVSPALSASLGVTAMLCVASQQANAQQTERVTVTGTNIPRAQTETASPVITLTRDAIEASGKPTLAAYLQTLPMDGQGSLPTSFGNGFATGSTAISLRGMGATSTLVLLNGRRVAPYGRADDGQKIFTDLSSIPIELVERIEVLLDGASAIYGADAIAGVVNIILRESFSGTVGTVSYARSQNGLGDTPRLSITHGAGNLATDRYSFILNAEYSASEQIFNRDIHRDWIGKADLRPWGYGLESAGGFSAGNDPGGSFWRHPPAGAVLNPTTGVYQALPGCSRFSRTADQSGVAPGGCLYYLDQFRAMQPKMETGSIYGRGTWQISGDTKAYAELGLSKKTSEFYTGLGGPSVTPTNFYLTGTANFASGSTLTNGRVIPPILIAATHPDNPFGAATSLSYQAFDVGPEIRQTDNQALRAVFGLSGNRWGWDYNTAYSHSETALDLTFKNTLNMDVVRAALSDPTSSYFPYRIGVNAGLNPASLYSAMRVDLTSTNKTKMDILDVKGSRELMQLDGGMMSMAAGAEYRREMFASPSFPGTIDGPAYASYVGSSGTQTVFAAYAELLAPVTKKVELSAALRHDAYKKFNSTTPKLGIKFTPVRALALRGTYAEGFRAPNATEFSAASQSAGAGSARDPVRCPTTGSAADCAAYFGLITTGNPNVQPEKTRSYTLGAVWDPLRNTSLTLDWWEIRRRDEINQMTLDQAAAQSPCTQVRADNNLPGIPCSGTLLGVFAPYQNSARSDLRGMDLGARQRFDLGAYGSATLQLRWSHLYSWQRTEKDGRQFEYAGTHGNCDISNCIGTPKDKVNLVLAWDRGSLRLAGLVNWRSSFENTYAKGQDCAVTYADGSTPAPNGCRIAAFWTMDLTLRWQAQKDLQVFGSIQNLFDRVAPLDPLTYGAVSYNPMDYSGAIGRVFSLGARYQFR